MANYPHLIPEWVPESIKGPPMLREAHLVVLSHKNILTCSCGLKHHYGIPCHHLFSLEPEYNLSAINFCYQGAYLYYAYPPDYREMTRALKLQCSIREHTGIFRKKSGGTPFGYTIPIHSPANFGFVWTWSTGMLELQSRWVFSLLLFSVSRWDLMQIWWLYTGIHPI